jgi:hypothetical protein
MFLQNGGAMGNKLRSVLVIIVAVVWAMNFLAPLWNKEYSPAPELNVAFMAILGVLTASYNKAEDKSESKKKKDDDEKKDKEDEPAAS